MRLKHVLPTVFVVATASFGGCGRRIDTAEVIAIDEGYEIHVRSEGNSSIPLSPEGPFAKWGRSNRFLALGPGKRTTIDGVVYKEYALGKDLETKGHANTFSICIIRISEDTKRLIMQGCLSAEDHTSFSPFGSYSGIKIDRPRVISLSAGDKIEDVDGRYIRAQGRYERHPQHPGAWRFRAEGLSFVVLDGLGEDGDFQIVGQVRCNMGGLNIDGLTVSSYKRIPPK